MIKNSDKEEAIRNIIKVYIEDEIEDKGKNAVSPSLPKPLRQQLEEAGFLKLKSYRDWADIEYARQYSAKTGNPLSSKYHTALETEILPIDQIMDYIPLYFYEIPFTFAGLVMCFLLFLKIIINHPTYFKTIPDHVYRTFLIALDFLKKHCTGRAK